MIPRDWLVHVGGPGRECAPGIVLRAAHVSLVRVLRPTPLGADPGLADEEGDVRNWREARWVPTPDGDARCLDTWHYQHECLSPIPYPVNPLATGDGYQLDGPAVPDEGSARWVAGQPGYLSPDQRENDPVHREFHRRQQAAMEGRP